jgi:uncharacterized alkaline shock family protein YloU
MSTVAITDGAVDESPAPVGATDLGRISISDTVVRKIAAKAASENPDVGAPATRLMGVPLPGVAGVGGHDSDLDGLPKTSVEVDGTLAFIEMEISVRWPKSVAAVTDSIRSHVHDRVRELTGLEAMEVRLTVADLVTDIPTPPRVR